VPPPAPSIWSYVEVFTLDSWIALATMVLVLSVTFLLLSDFGVSGSLHTDLDSESFGVANGFGLSTMMFMNLRYSVEARSLSSKVILFISSMASYVISVHYNSDLGRRRDSYSCANLLLLCKTLSHF
jgi:hypothetical protein